MPVEPGFQHAIDYRQVNLGGGGLPALTALLPPDNTRGGTLVYDRPSGAWYGLVADALGVQQWASIGTGGPPPGSAEWPKYVVSTGTPTDPIAPYQQVQAAIDAAVADGHGMSSPAVVLVHPGTYTEDLVFHAGIYVCGLNTELHRLTILQGAHVFLPVAGPAPVIPNLPSGVDFWEYGISNVTIAATSASYPLNGVFNFPSLVLLSNVFLVNVYAMNLVDIDGAVLRFESCIFQSNKPASGPLQSALRVRGTNTFFQLILMSCELSNIGAADPNDYVIDIAGVVGGGLTCIDSQISNGVLLGENTFSQIHGTTVQGGTNPSAIQMSHPVSFLGISDSEIEATGYAIEGTGQIQQYASNVLRSSRAFGLGLNWANSQECQGLKYNDEIIAVVGSVLVSQSRDLSAIDTTSNGATQDAFLPPLAETADGQRLTVHNLLSSPFDVSLLGNAGAETVDFSPAANILAPGQSMTVQASRVNGTWLIVSRTAAGGGASSFPLRFYVDPAATPIPGFVYNDVPTAVAAANALAPTDVQISIMPGFYGGLGGLPVNNNVTLIGMGSAPRTVTLQGQLQFINGGTPNGMSNICLRTDGAHCLDVTNGDQQFFNCIFENLDVSVARPVQLNGGSNTLFLGCRVINQATGEGIQAGAVNLVLENTVVRVQSGGPIYRAIDVSLTGSLRATNCTITGAVRHNASSTLYLVDNEIDNEAGNEASISTNAVGPDLVIVSKCRILTPTGLESYRDLGGGATLVWEQNAMPNGGAIQASQLSTGQGTQFGMRGIPGFGALPTGFDGAIHTPGASGDVLAIGPVSAEAQDHLLILKNQSNVFSSTVSAFGTPFDADPTRFFLTLQPQQTTMVLADPSANTFRTVSHFPLKFFVDPSLPNNEGPVFNNLTDAWAAANATSPFVGSVTIFLFPGNYTVGTLSASKSISLLGTTGSRTDVVITATAIEPAPGSSFSMTDLSFDGEVRLNGTTRLTFINVVMTSSLTNIRSVVGHANDVVRILSSTFVATDANIQGDISEQATYEIYDSQFTAGTNNLRLSVIGVGPSTLRMSNTRLESTTIGFSNLIAHGSISLDDCELVGTNNSITLDAPVGTTFRMSGSRVRCSSVGATALLVNSATGTMDLTLRGNTFTSTARSVLLNTQTAPSSFESFGNKYLAPVELSHDPQTNISCMFDYFSGRLTGTGGVRLNVSGAPPRGYFLHCTFDRDGGGSPAVFETAGPAPVITIAGATTPEGGTFVPAATGNDYIGTHVDAHRIDPASYIGNSVGTATFDGWLWQIDGPGQTFTLPDVNRAMPGKEYILKVFNPLTFAGGSIIPDVGQTIDGFGSFSITADARTGIRLLAYSSTTWLVVGTF